MRVSMAMGQILIEWVLDKLRIYFLNTPVELGISLEELALYVDNGRTFCTTFNWGVRFTGESFTLINSEYNSEKEANRDREELTHTEILKAHNSLSDHHSFTGERECDFEDG